MILNQYQEWVVGMWSSRRPVKKGARRTYTLRDHYIMTAGLAGEVGEVMEHLKKAVRDGKKIDQEELTLELGDVLYYLLAIADAQGIKADDIIAANISKLNRRYAKKKYRRRSR